MTSEEIIRMAREADKYADKYAPSFSRKPDEWRAARDEQFAALVADAEREACAKVCDSFVDLAEAEKAKLRTDYARSAGDEEDELRAMRHELTVSTFNAGIGKCAASIRARSKK